MSKYSSVILICSLIVGLVQAVPEGRIVGGISAVEEKFPYQVSLKFNGAHDCGGSIISKNYILTAAHCISDKYNNYAIREVSTLSVQAGTTHREIGGVRIPVAETIVHPRFFNGGSSADIALVRLAEPLTFSETIQPIELSSDDVPENTPVVVSGWGDIEGGVEPEELQWTVLEGIPQLSCSLKTGYSPDKILCLESQRYTGACYGDSGGPAVVEHRLVGVASFVKGTCGIDTAGYVKVSGYLDWIKEHSDVSEISEE